MDPPVPEVLGRRTAAKLTDAALIGWLAANLAGAGVTWTLGPDAWDFAINSATTVGLIADIFFLLLAPFLFVAMQSVSMWAWGATPGKLVWGLAVVTPEGATPGFWKCVRRTLAEFPSAIVLGWGYFTAFTNPRRQTWHDKSSSTGVVPVAVNRIEWFGKERSRRSFGATTAVVLILSGPVVQMLAPQVHSLSQPAADRHIRAGIRAHSAGDHGKALEAFTKAIEAAPHSSLAYANRGAVYGDMGDRDHQIEDCTKALALDSTQVFALLGRANAYRIQGALDQSSADYSTVIRLRPGWSGLVYAYRGRGANHFREGDLDAAAADFREGARIGRENYLGTSDLPKGVDFREAIAMCYLLRYETLLRKGDIAAADSEWLHSKETIVSNFRTDEARKSVTESWLGSDEARKPVTEYWLGK